MSQKRFHVLTAGMAPFVISYRGVSGGRLACTPLNDCDLIESRALVGENVFDTLNARTCFAERLQQQCLL